MPWSRYNSDEPDVIRWSRDGNPIWWDKELEGVVPCKCGVDPKVLQDETGYSDSYFALLECPKCGKRWQEYMES